MDITATDYEPAPKLNSLQCWVFSWSLLIATCSSEQGKPFATFATNIYISIKKSWPNAKSFIKVQVNSSKSALEVRGIIWTSGDKEPLFNQAGGLPYPTVEDLQSRIKRQAKRAKLKIVDEEVTGLELNLLCEKPATGNWASSALNRTILCSSFYGDLEFVYLITMDSSLSYDGIKEVTDRMEFCTGQNFGWIEYHGRIPSGQVSSRS